MTTESVAQSVSNLALSFGDDDADPGAMSRPFGVALLLAGCDEDKVGHVVSLACTVVRITQDLITLYLTDGSRGKQNLTR